MGVVVRPAAGAGLRPGDGEGARRRHTPHPPPLSEAVQPPDRLSVPREGRGGRPSVPPTLDYISQKPLRHTSLAPPAPPGAVHSVTGAPKWTTRGMRQVRLVPPNYPSPPPRPLPCRYPSLVGCSVLGSVASPPLHGHRPTRGDVGGAVAGPWHHFPPHAPPPPPVSRGGPEPRSVNFHSPPPPFSHRESEPVVWGRAV